MLRRKMLRDIMKYKSQFIAIFVTIVLGMASFISFFTAAESLNKSYTLVYEKLKYEDFEVVFNFAPESVIRNVSRISNIKAVEGRLEAETGIYINERLQIGGLAIGINSTARPRVNDLEIIDGSYFQSNESECLLEHHFASAYGYKAGDNITLIINGEKVNFVIRGIVMSPEYIIIFGGGFEISVGYTFGVVFVPLRFLQQKLEMPHTITKIVATVKDKTKLDDTISEVKSALKDYPVIQISKREDLPAYSGLKADIDGFYLIAYVFSAILFFITIIEIYIILTRIIFTQRRIIGALKAIGVPKKKIIMHYLMYSLTIWLIGIIAGCILAIPLSEEILTFYISTLRIPYKVIVFKPSVFVMAILMSLLSCFIASIFPTLNVARTTPMEALRPYLVSMMVKGRTTLFEKIINKFCDLSISSRISLRNLFRNRIRSYSMIICITFCVMVLFSSVALLSSFQMPIEQQYTNYELWDLRANFFIMKNISDLNEIESWDGVISVEYFISSYAVLTVGSKNVTCQLIAYQENITLHRFNIISGKLLQGGKIILTYDLAEELNIEIGTNITLEINGIKENISVVGIDKEPLLMKTCFITLKTAYRILSVDDMANGMLLDVSKDKVSEIRRKIYNVKGIKSVDVRADIYYEWERAIQSLSVMIYAMIFIGILISAALVFTMVTVDIMDRNYEIATLRVLGFKLRRLMKIITLEILLTSFIGIILGLIFGYIVTNEYIRILAEEFSGQLFYIETYIDPIATSIVILAIILGILISELPSFRYIAKMDIARMAKEASL